MTGDARVVAMTLAHLPAVAALVAELGYADEAAGVADRFAGLAGDADNGLFVAVNGAGADEVVGFVHVAVRRTLHDEAGAQVLAMAVATAHRRRGIGALLLTRAEAWAAERGLATVMLYSAGHRDDAQRFYAAQGYAPKVGVNRYDKSLATAGKSRKA